MYDYKSAICVDSKMELLVIKDTREREIVDKLKGITSKTNNQKQPERTQNIKQFLMEYIFPASGKRKIERVSNGFIFPKYLVTLAIFSSELETPPPEII